MTLMSQSFCRRYASFQYLRQLLYCFVTAVLFSVPYCITGEDSEQQASKPAVYIAIAGGGFRAHNTATAFFSGLLDRSDNNIEKLMQNVEGFSGNSGGAWFLSQLLFSNRFNDALIKNRDHWFDSGYMKQLEDKFLHPDICSTYSKFLRKLCLRYKQYEFLFVLAKIKGANPFSLNWINSVNDTVFYPLRLKSELKKKTLGSDKVDWAKNKFFVIAAAILADSVKLKGSRFYHHQYSIATDENKLLLSLPVFIGSTIDLPPKKIKIHYSTNFFSKDASQSTLTLPKKIYFDTDKVSLLEAVGYSSSALAGLASSQANRFLFHQSNEIFLDMAPAVSLFDQGLASIDPQEMKLSDMKNRAVVRMADGGYNDNSSLAYLMHEIQKKDKHTPFTIILVDGDFKHHDIFERYSVRKKYKKEKVKDLFILKAFSLLNKKTLHEFENKDVKVSLIRLSVETARDSYIDIKPGQRGEVIVFRTVSKNFANRLFYGLIPHEKEIFDLYRKEFEAIRKDVPDAIYNELFKYLR